MPLTKVNAVVIFCRCQICVSAVQSTVTLTKYSHTHKK